MFLVQDAAGYRACSVLFAAGVVVAVGASVDVGWGEVFAEGSGAGAPALC
jgi:hypothetical protein